MVRTRSRFLVNRALAIIAYVYGWGVASRLSGMNIEVEYYDALRRIKHVYVNGKVAFSIRASDGLLIPTLYGASLLDSWIKVNDETAQYVKQGRSVPVKGVIEVRNVVQNMDAAIIDEEGNVVGVGRLLIMPEEAKTVDRGFMVKTRHHVKVIKGQEQ
ncbi:PUA domain-containing protein [Caldivirga maquilingensis]|uniref:PUA domain containing protein n=1 Tax=Caldivirga maquilingensis (strain ATCC 700844 / DSM 13496 / JCM 10307 / IC-167) TaxID=397948 RepID=A8M9D8_CALMQ|nr:PUA domain-containing protein [Caldivirga maquilingensis]ABW02357.1 PUA domain containing protein [Caldivirga maquilingensis IC-167]